MGLAARNATTAAKTATTMTVGVTTRFSRVMLARGFFWSSEKRRVVVTYLVFYFAGELERFIKAQKIHPPEVEYKYTP